MKTKITSPIIRAYERALETKEKRNWEKIFILVDLHATVIHPNWSNTELPEETYPNAVEVLSILTQDPEVCLILWTSSWERDYIQYRKMLESLGVVFDYVNENPEVLSKVDGYGCYDKKPYFNVIFDDKAGFEPQDWNDLRTFFSA